MSHWQTEKHTLANWCRGTIYTMTQQFCDGFDLDLDWRQFKQRWVLESCFSYNKNLVGWRLLTQCGSEYLLVPFDTNNVDFNAAFLTTDWLETFDTVSDLILRLLGRFSKTQAATWGLQKNMFCKIKTNWLYLLFLSFRFFVTQGNFALLLPNNKNQRFS